MAKVNFEAIVLEVAKSPAFKAEALRQAKLNVRLAKEELLEEFDNHVVTQELEEGPTASNISGTLEGLSSSHGGNLFSFLGFFEGDKPTKTIREALKRKIDILNTNVLFSRYSKGGLITVGFRVNTLDIDDFEDVIDYPDGYQSGNLLKDLEKGQVKGLSHYIYDEDFGIYGSRSGTGLEAKTRKGKLINIRDGNTNNAIPYIGKLLDDFARKLRAGV